MGRSAPFGAPFHNRGGAIGFGVNPDGLHAHFRQRPLQFDMQQAVIEPRTFDIYTLRQHKGAQRTRS